MRRTNNRHHSLYTKGFVQHSGFSFHNEIDEEPRFATAESPAPVTVRKIEDVKQDND